MDRTQIKYVIEAALLASGRPLPLDKIASLFATKAAEMDRQTLRAALDELAADYKERGLELKEVASGYRIQIKSSMTPWLTPLWEERAPRYTRALLETLALIAYRQPITRAEIEDVRGVGVSTNITRTLLERNWVRVVGHRDVPGKPAMFGTTREFLDYFGLKKLEDLPTLADIKDGLPEESPQADLIEALFSIDENGEGAALDTASPELGGDEVGVVIAQAASTQTEEGPNGEPDEGLSEVAHAGTDEAVDEAVDAADEDELANQLANEAADELANEAADELAKQTADELAGEAADEITDDSEGGLADEPTNGLADEPKLADEPANGPADGAAGRLAGEAADGIRDEAPSTAAAARWSTDSAREASGEDSEKNSPENAEDSEDSEDSEDIEDSDDSEEGEGVAQLIRSESH